MNDQVWLTLAKKINELLKRPDIDGIVITHGTDTMEAVSYTHLTYLQMVQQLQTGPHINTYLRFLLINSRLLFKIE